MSQYFTFFILTLSTVSSIFSCLIITSVNSSGFLTFLPDPLLAVGDAVLPFFNLEGGLAKNGQEGSLLRCSCLLFLIYKIRDKLNESE